MKIFIKKGFCYILLLCILVSTIFGNPIISYAKEKTGEQMVSEIIKELDLTDLSYFNKVLICGEWIAENISYDYEGLEKGTENRTLLETMKERKGVCQGYAIVFKEFMEQIGVPCLYISDTKMNHAYNIVLMNDYKWYLVEPQSSLSAGWEQDIYKDYINEVKERILIWNEMGYDTEDEEEEIRMYEEKLKLLDGRGEFLLDDTYDRNNFLNGIKDFENHTIASGSGYYEFVKLAKSKVHGYPVATTKLRNDPDKEQKQFINKSDVTFTKSNITINAATCKTSVKLPISVNNYTISDLKFDTDKFYIYDLTKKKKIAKYTYYPELFRSLFASNLNLIAYKDISSMSFQLTIKTMYGNEATANISIKYPQLTQKVYDSLYNGVKVGKKIKLGFTEGAKLKDFNIYIEKDDLKYAEYNSKTGEIKGKKSGVATLLIKSKTNKNYTLSYTVIVK
ncbi:transglutaminase-like domain-containing protein [Mobilisporobacter senegalensis]|nr:transglutaminase-like domain-containing protein [Mobilisporobacter senegalensis]